MNNGDIFAYGTFVKVGEESVQHGGLTKREHFAATMNHDAESIRFDKVETLQEFIGRSVSVTDVNDLTLAVIQAEAKARVMRADALLAALGENMD